MRTWMETATTAAVTLAAVAIGTPVLATLIMPMVFPAVVAAGALYAWRADGQ